MLATCVAAIAHVADSVHKASTATFRCWAQQADKSAGAQSSVPASSQPCSDVRLLWPNATDTGVHVDIDHQQGDRGQL
jgi:hypothetical protein